MQECLTLEGDFKVDTVTNATTPERDASINVTQNIETVGTFTFNSGELWIQCKKHFCFASLAGQAACTVQLLPCGVGADCCIFAPQTAPISYTCNQIGACSNTFDYQPNGACILGGG